MYYKQIYDSKKNKFVKYSESPSKNRKNWCIYFKYIIIICYFYKLKSEIKLIRKWNKNIFISLFLWFCDILKVFWNNKFYSRYNNYYQENKKNEKELIIKLELKYERYDIRFYKLLFCFEISSHTCWWLFFFTFIE